MKAYIFKRLTVLAITLLVVSFFLFILGQLQPGNPYYNAMQPGMSEEQIEKYLIEQGYYAPIYIKYKKWFCNVLKGDFGYSIRHKVPVLSIIKERISNTLFLTVSALVFSIMLAIPAGIKWALNEKSFFARFLDGISLAISSLPTFLLALILVKFLSYDLNLFPLSGVDTFGRPSLVNRIYHFILPIIVLTLINFSNFVRYIKSWISAELKKPYIKTSMSFGMTKAEAVKQDALRNILSSIVTLIFLEVPHLLSGALITESFFVIPGIGKLNYDAVLDKDYPVVMAILIFSITLVLFSNFCADILNYRLDKRQEV